MTRSLCSLLLLWTPLYAQTPAFEVAAIKPNHSGLTDQHSDSDNDRLTCVNMTLKRYIAKAWRVRDDQIEGPGWLASERFDLTAKASGIVNDEMISQMLETLLAERFKLAVHREPREGRVYALTVAKGGVKLQPVEATGGSTTSATRASLTVEGASMDRVAGALSRHLDFPVVNQTGLDGVYSFKLAWDPASTELSSSGTPGAGPSIFTALQKELGLKLESRKMPVEVLVIDHVERVPAEN